MNATIIGIIGLIVFVVLVALGMWIGLAAAVVGLIGMWLIIGWEGMAGLAGCLPYAITASFPFSCMPLFILMGYFSFYSGVGHDLYTAARQWVGHVHGGLAIATTFSCAGFAACTGSSTACAAVFGKIAIPEMRQYNYDTKLATGVVAASGTIASMIPPSIGMVIYGVLTEQSVALLLIAGFFPGILEAVLYGISIYLRCWRNPTLGPAVSAVSWKVRFASLRSVWPVLALLAVVLGGLYLGVFTETEAGGAGAFGALIITLAMRKLTWSNLKASLLETGVTTAMIFAILVGVLIFLRFLAFSGITDFVIKFMVGLPVPPMVTLTFILLGYFVLGMFVSATGMMVLTLPVIFPVVMQLGFDPIWFGILVIRMGEIAVITPPVAVNVFAVKSVTPDIPLEDIMRGITPFVIVDCINVVLLVLFPQISVWLPSTMKR